MKRIIDYILEKKFDKYLNHRYPDDEVKSVVWDYVAGFITNVNDELRNGKNAKEITDLFDKAFKDKSKLDLYRTVEWDYLKNIYGITKDNINDKIGEELVNKGYMSCSEEFISPWGDRWSDDEVILHIVSDKPYPNINVNKTFNKDEIDCSEQKEVLLPRNTKLKILSVYIKKGKQFSKDGNYYIETKII